MTENPSIELISAGGLAVFASIPRVSKTREATPKQLLSEPYDNVLFIPTQYDENRFSSIWWCLAHKKRTQRHSAVRHGTKLGQHCSLP